MAPGPAAIRTVEVFPGGPTLHIPPDWPQERIDATLALLRAQAPQSPS